MCIRDREDVVWQPKLDAEARARSYGQWKKAVTRTFDWVDSSW